MSAQGRLLGGRYQVGELLGYGGMAEVHKGRDLRLGRDVAIKMLRVDLARDDTFQLRFRREAQNAASLNHPAIVAVYDTGEERGASGESLPYIVMEFVNGRTLKEVLAAEGRLQSRRALEICAEICAALEFSHRHGIIHRDIKPGNVMLTQTGQVKVMDFGIARALASGASTMTQTSAVIGTAQYLSPEQARGEAVDARSDVYATGCVVYELLCGQPPFVGDSPVSVAYQHVREDAHPPSEMNRDVVPAVDAIVLKALAKNPANRYQSAGEMRADLLRAAAGRPVYAEPVMREADFATATSITRPVPTGQRSDGRPGEQRRRGTSGWVIAALTALAVLAVVALVAGIIIARQPKPVVVPNLVNKTIQQATAELNQLKLGADPEQIRTASCKPGQVMSQGTAPGTEVAVGTAVKITYCVGRNEKTVPSVVGDQLADAQRQLTEAGLTSEVENVDSHLPANQVISADPAPGKKVLEGSLVKLTVSKGNQIEVPNVSNGNLSQQAAIELLTEKGFTQVVPVTTPEPNPNRVGKVVRQSPEAGAKRAADTKITIFVGTAIVKTTPPATTAPTTSPPASPPAT